MKKISLGIAVALLSTVAYAQTSQAPTGDAGSTSSSTTSSGTTAPMRRIPSGHANRAETSGSPQTRPAGALSTDVSTRTRTDGDNRVEGRSRIGVSVGVSSHDGGVSVRRRTVREYDEPSVSVTRRRTVTSYEEPSIEVHRTVVKKAKPSVKKVVVRKKKLTSKVVVRSRRHYVVDEPVEIRRRTVRRYEVDEPNVSVRHRTTIRQSQDVRPSVGISVEQRRGGIRQSNDVGMSVTRERSTSSPETTGTISSRTRMNTTGGAGSASSRATGSSSISGSTDTSGGAPIRRLQQNGSSSSGDGNQ